MITKITIKYRTVLKVEHKCRITLQQHIIYTVINKNQDKGVKIKRLSTVQTQSELSPMHPSLHIITLLFVLQNVRDN